MARMPTPTSKRPVKNAAPSPEPASADGAALTVSAPKTLSPLLLKGRFPKDLATAEAMNQFLAVCISTGLNPFLGEILPIHGRIYVTEVGWLRLIDQRRPNTLLVDDVRLGSEEEARALGIMGSGWLAIATVTRLLNTARGPVERTTTEQAFLSMGAVNASPIDAVREEPWRQAAKIARVRALRRAYPDVVYECVSEAPEPVLPEWEDEELLPEHTDDQVAERSRFWARCREYGIVNGSVELANIFHLPEAGIGAMKKHWLDAGHTWFEANETLDAWAASLPVDHAIIEMETKE